MSGKVSGKVSGQDGSGDSRSDTATAQLVEQGVEFYKVLGRTVATAYLKEHHVPTEVIYRILGSSAACRPSVPSRTPRMP